MRRARWIFLMMLAFVAVARAISVDEGYWDGSTLFKIRHIEILDDRGRALDGLVIRGYTGAAASRKNMDALHAEVKEYLLSRGFPFATILSEATLDSSSPKTVDLNIRVHLGDAFKLGEVRPLETRTQSEVVSRLALWKTGESFSPERLEQGLKRLGRTGYYESAALTGLFRDSLRNLIYPVLRIPDLPGNRLSGLLGYDSKALTGSQLTGFADLHLINMFGTARDLDFTFDSRAGNEREVHLAYVEPWILQLPVGARVEVNFLQQDTLFWEWNRDLTFFQDLNFNSRLEVRFGDQQNRDLILATQTHALRSGLRWIYDGRDRVPLTSSGYRMEVGATGLRRQTGDSLYYLVQGSGIVDSWIPLTSRIGLKLGLHAASNFPLSRMNQGELYFVGGANSLRGYREREFPTNAYVLGQAELQLWLNRRGRLFAFTDPGLVNRLVSEYSWRRVIGYGAGIEISKGNWGLALTYALSPERAPGDGLLHVGVDNRF